MDELDDYGSFNTRYEGIGRLVYIPGEDIHVYFEARQLADGRLVVACVSTGKPISDGPVRIDGHLLSGEPFSTIWTQSIKEIYRSEGNISKAHYVAKAIRVRYTHDVQPDDRSIQLALHNFIPGRNSDVSNNSLGVHLQDYTLTIAPVGNYGQQAKQLLRHGGNLRTSWVTTQVTDIVGKPRTTTSDIQKTVTEMLTPISLALGTLVTCPQIITLDASGDRNDVEHYSCPASEFSDFICAQEWDSPVKDTAEAWFSNSQKLISSEELTVNIHQHLDACSTKVYLETRAMVAATLLDVLAGRYATTWAPQKQVIFRERLSRLLGDLGIVLRAGHLNAVITARNSLVHEGGFVTSDRDKTYSQYQNLMLLGRSILLRLAGVSSRLYEKMVS